MVPFQVISKPQARAAGLRHYFTGKPCPQGHASKRFVANGQCSDCNTERHRSYVQRNKESIRKKYLAYCEANAEQIRAKDRRYRAENLQRINARRATVEAKAVAAYLSSRRRARELAAPGSHSAADIKRLIQKCPRCYLCGKRLNKKRQPTIDHVLAISGPLGSDDFSNLALACDYCNKRKSARRENPFTGQGILL